MRGTLTIGLLVLAVLGLVWLPCSAPLDPGATGDAAARPAEPEREPERPEPPVAEPPVAELVEGATPEAREPVAAAGAMPRDTRFAGRLVDVDTGEAVPWYELAVFGPGGQAEQLTSDGEGFFATSAVLAPGPMRITLVDVEGQAGASSSRRGAVTIEHGTLENGTLENVTPEKPSEVRIDVGPTYFIDVALPDALVPADLRVRLFVDPPGLEGERVDEETCATILRAPRGGSPFAWARFRKTNLGRRKPQWLQLATVDGLWVGGARVPTGPGVHPEPVHVTLTSACAVRGRYVSGEPHARGAGALALFRDEGTELEPRWESTDREGRFRIAGLEPGRYRLEVRDEAVRAAPVTFALRSGESDLGELPWQPIPVAGSVRLRVQSAIEIPIDVQLVRRFDAPRHPLWHSDSWKPLSTGGFESRFEWDEVHAGAFEIVVHTHDLGNWRLSLGELEPPVDDLVVRLPAPPPPLTLTVVDDESGAPLDAWSVLVRGERGWEEPHDGRETLRFAVWNEDTAFAVCSPGYRAWVARPGTADFSAAADGRVTARLRRGWSQLFLAGKRTRGSPLEGVEIRLDGRSVGRTDARGELWVDGDAAAQELEVTHAFLVWSEEAWAPLDEHVTWLTLHP